jgi:hypothetical protein
MGWYGDSLENHITYLEKNEMNQSKMRSKISVAPQPAPTPADQPGMGMPGFPQQSSVQQPPVNPAQPTYTIPVTPVVEATQGELGLEAGEKYNYDFENELAFLKQNIVTEEKDPKLSGFASEIKRKEAINADAMDLDFLRALQGISANIPAPGAEGQGAINLGLGGQATQPGLSNLLEKTQIHPSGFNPNPANQGPQNNGGFNMSEVNQVQAKNNVSVSPVFNMSGVSQVQAKNNVSVSPAFNMSGIAQPQNQGNGGFNMSGLNNGEPGQTQDGAGLNQIPGWGAAGAYAFGSMHPTFNQPQKQDSIFGKLDNNMSPSFPAFPGQKNVSAVSPFPPQNSKPKMASSDFIGLLRRVGV